MKDDAEKPPARPDYIVRYQGKEDVPVFREHFTKGEVFYVSNITRIVKPGSTVTVGVTKLSAAKRAARKLKTARRAPPPGLNRLIALCDFAPINLRRQLKAMAGDYQPEIIRLHKAGRRFAARFNVLLAWGTAGAMLLKAPLRWSRDVLVRAISGK